MKLRRLIFPVLCLLFAGFVWKNQDQATAFWRVLGGAKFIPLAIAVLFQIGTLINQPALFHAIYKLVGINASWCDLAPAVLAGRFINVVTPAAGLGETALLFEQAKRRGWDAGRIALITTLYFALNFAVFAVILVAGFALLAVHNELKGFEIFAAIPIILGVFLGAALLARIAADPQLLERWILKSSSRLPLRLSRPLASLGESTRNFSQALGNLRGSRQSWSRPIIHAILVDGLEIAVLAACLSSFGVAFSAPILISSYVIGTLFTIVSLTPQGVGTVEGAMGATLISFGVPLPHATAVVLTYRGLSFWLPLLVGFVATRVWSKDLSGAKPANRPLHIAAPRH